MIQLIRNLIEYIKKQREKKVCLIFLGLDNAGKTTLLTTMKGEIPRDILATCGFKSEAIPMPRRFSQYTVSGVDLGGGVNFRGIWPKFLPQNHGCIYVVDSADELRLAESRETFHKILQQPTLKGKPILILANKQDLPAALDEQAVAQALGMDDRIESPFLVRKCTALRREGDPVDPGILEGLGWLMERIDKSYIELVERVTLEEKEFQEREEIAKEEKRKLWERLKKEQEEKYALEQKRIENITVVPLPAQTQTQAPSSSPASAATAPPPRDPAAIPAPWLSSSPAAAPPPRDPASIPAPWLSSAPTAPPPRDPASIPAPWLTPAAAPKSLAAAVSAASSTTHAPPTTTTTANSDGTADRRANPAAIPAPWLLSQSQAPPPPQPDPAQHARPSLAAALASVVPEAPPSSSSATSPTPTPVPPESAVVPSSSRPNTVPGTASRSANLSSSSIEVNPAQAGVIATIVPPAVDVRLSLSTDLPGML